LIIFNSNHGIAENRCGIIFQDPRVPRFFLPQIPLGVDKSACCLEPGRPENPPRAQKLAGGSPLGCCCRHLGSLAHFPPAGGSGEAAFGGHLPISGRPKLAGTQNLPPGAPGAPAGAPRLKCFAGLEARRVEMRRWAANGPQCREKGTRNLPHGAPRLKCGECASSGLKPDESKCAGGLQTGPSAPLRGAGIGTKSDEI